MLLLKSSPPNPLDSSLTSEPLGLFSQCRRTSLSALHVSGLFDTGILHTGSMRAYGCITEANLPFNAHQRAEWLTASARLHLIHRWLQRGRRLKADWVNFDNGIINKDFGRPHENFIHSFMRKCAQLIEKLLQLSSDNRSHCT